MSDGLTRGFHAQLTISMDAVLRRAVFEIMNIFENTVHDYQMELAHKGEEVSQLKIKLQTAELRLKDQVYGMNGGQEVVQASNQTRTPPEAINQTPAQPSAMSEADVDAVPEDWCAPLCETLTIQDVGVSPGVKLRRLSIPLWNIPIRKTEGGYCDIDTNLKTRKSRRFAASSNQKIPPFEKLPVPNLKQESPDPVQLEDLRRSKRTSAGEMKKQVVKRKKKEKSSAAEPRSTEVNTVGKDVENLYSCKICKAVFGTVYGLRVHARHHKKCRGCKEIFSSKRLLMRHKLSCRKLKKQSAATTNMLTASKKPTAIKKESTPYPDSKLSTNKDASTKMYSCPHCDTTCASPVLLKQHLSIHFSKKLTPCSLCPMMFRNKRGMRIHRTKAHENNMNSSKGTEDLAWTEPVEEIDNETQDFISICTKSNQKSNPSNNEEQNSVMNVKWQTGGKETPKRSSCLLCLKLFNTKYDLIEHMRVHE